MRLNRYLAACGLGSRRRCEDLIAAGRVRVNGEIADFGTPVGDEARVTVDDALVQPPTSRVVWMLHKPSGVVCTADDTHGRATVVELAKKHGIAERVFPIGRLDLDTTGLLLLTNDGDLSHRLTHPSMGVDKEYEATVALPLTQEALDRLRHGIELEDGHTAPCRCEQRQDAGRSVVCLVLHEGRKRQVRRMLAALGHPVVALHRVRVGGLVLGDLGVGALRRLDEAEISTLLEAFSTGDATPAPDVD